ncbi:MAG: hypothetical protein QG652_1392 [Pseudomonadota bacterium]|nr:hypothetical protein [Pseudomonadota bacterium]
MQQYKLILYPALADNLQMEVIITALMNCGLISGKSIHDKYLAGDSFLNLLTFLGCSPDVCLTPQDDDKFCHIIIRPPQSTIRCLGHTATAVARCPHCKNKIPHWRQTKDWESGETFCSCHHCHAETAMQDMIWKQECAYGCMAVEIINIHPFEAVPAENLLQVLQDATGVEWNYSYAFDKWQVPRYK